ncbi:MAG: DMT family transporter [Candidatus Diapherotrites archaeon]|nr:DMT family transporter [Candidatus Diapherotrites archaeon]
MINSPVASMTVLSQANLVFIMILAFLILKEVATREELMASAVAFVGILLINPFEATSSFWSFVMILSSFTYAISVITIRKTEMSQGIGIAFWYLLIASLFLLPLALSSGFGDWSSALGLIVLLGLLNAGFYFTLDLALKSERVDEVGVVYMVFNPLTASIFAFLILSQVPTFNTLLGIGALSLGGVIIWRELAKD